MLEGSAGRLWSAKMMRAAVWASCGFAGQLVFMVQHALGHPLARTVQ
jgi:hypothetical protein